MHSPVLSSDAGQEGGVYPMDAATFANRWKRDTGDTRVAKAIEGYALEVANDRVTKKTPVALFRLANLYYSEVKDYEKASEQYERLLREHPDFSGGSLVFLNLAACYGHLGDLEMEERTYEIMADFFPPDSAETLFARQQIDVGHRRMVMSRNTSESL